MKFIRREEMILDANSGKLVAIIPAEEDALASAIIEFSPEIFALMVKYVIDVEQNSFKPKMAYKAFKEIINKIPEYLYDLQRFTGEVA